MRGQSTWVSQGWEAAAKLCPCRLRCSLCEGHPDVLRNRPGKVCEWEQSLRFLLSLMNWKTSLYSPSTSYPLIIQSCCSLNNSTSQTPLNAQPYLCQLTNRADRLQMKSCSSLSTCRMWRELVRQEGNRRPPIRENQPLQKVDEERINSIWCLLRNMKAKEPRSLVVAWVVVVSLTTVCLTTIREMWKEAVSGKSEMGQSQEMVVMTAVCGLKSEAGKFPWWFLPSFILFTHSCITHTIDHRQVPDTTEAGAC